MGFSRPHKVTIKIAFRSKIDSGEGHPSLPERSLRWFFALFRGILSSRITRSGQVPRMSELKSLVPKPDRRLLPAPPHTSQEPKQRRMMVIALTLLLVALGFVLYHDRDFWFPETQEAEDQPQARPATKVAAQPPVVSKSTPQVGKSRHRGAVVAKTKPPDPATAAPSDPPFATATRTVLPPLEVEVVAGNVHRSVRPGTNSVRVDLQPGSPAQLPNLPSSTTRPQPASPTLLPSACKCPLTRPTWSAAR
jgi:hypothetical protein